MSVNQSNLSSTVLDFVVAVSEESINSTMFQFLSETDFPVLSLCWTSVNNGSLTPINLKDLMAGNASNGGTNGTNPFNVPNWDGTGTPGQDIQNIVDSNFVCGIQLQLGIPSGMNIPGSSNQAYKNTLPYVVTQNTSSTNTAIFNLLFSQFTVVYPQYGKHGISEYVNDSQPEGTSWGLTVNAPLNQITIPPVNAPATVQQALQAAGPGAFSIMQLYFDFVNAVITQLPTQNWPAMITNEITIGMIQTLIQQSEASQGLSTVGYTITSATVPESTFGIGNLEMVFDQYRPVSDSTQMLNTLNYLCTVPGGNLIPSNYSAIDWNWFESASQLGKTDGYVAINRNTLTKWIYQQLIGNVTENCFAAYVNVSCDDFLCGSVTYSWNLTPNQTPTVTYPSSGTQVINISYSNSSYDQCGLDGDMGRMTLSPSYNATITFDENTIVVVQHLVVYLKVQRYQTSADGNVVDKTITDTYTLGINENGKISPSLKSVTTDNSDNPSVNPFLDWFVDINTVISDIATWVQNFAPTNFTDIPVSFINGLVFPGSQTFTFSNPVFSDNQDLVSAIVYNDPVQQNEVYTTEGFSKTSVSRESLQKALKKETDKQEA